MALVLFGSCASVDRTVRAYRQGTLGLEHDEHGRLLPPRRATVLLPTRRRPLLALRKAPPRTDGWCRARWRGATLALTRQSTRGLTVSAETLRRWLHARGWVWKRPPLVAKDHDPPWLARVAHSRSRVEQLKCCAAMVCAEALESHL